MYILIFFNVKNHIKTTCMPVIFLFYFFEKNNRTCECVVSSYFSLKVSCSSPFFFFFVTYIFHNSYVHISTISFQWFAISASTLCIKALLPFFGEVSTESLGPLTWTCTFSHAWLDITCISKTCDAFQR